MAKHAQLGDNPTGTTGTRTAGQALVDGLVAHGVKTVFGIPSVQTYALFDAFAGYARGLSLIVPRHEQTCAYMAFGYAQSTGDTGVCTVVPGPGVLNAAAGLLTAFGASTPIVVLTSDVPTNFMGRGMGHVHELNNPLDVVGHFSKWAANVVRPEDAPALTAEAFYRARAGRPGPTVLACPWDVLPASGSMSSVEPLGITSPTPDEALLSEAANLLALARNPMIMVCGGARAATAAITALARHLQAPVVSFRAGRGIVADSDALGFRCATGFERWGDTDVLLAIGSRQELVWLRWPDKPARLRTINIDIDPAQHERLQPDVALVGDAVAASDALLQKVLKAVPPRDSRLAEFTTVKSRVAAEQAATLQPHVDYLRAIRTVLPDDGFFVDELSQIGFSSVFAFPVNQPRRFITAGAQHTLGYGYPTSLGVKAAYPEVPVVSVSGDGGFLFGASELATAAQYGLGVVAIVFDNAGYGNVQADQERIYGRQCGAELRNPDFAQMAHTYGVRRLSRGESRTTASCPGQSAL